MNENLVRAMEFLIDEVTLNPDFVTYRTKDYCKLIHKFVQAENETVRNEISNLLLEIAKKTRWQNAVYLFSMVFCVERKERVMREALMYMQQHEKEIDTSALNFLYRQWAGLNFRYAETQSEENFVLLWNLFQRTTTRYAGFLEEFLTPIAHKERDQNFVIVLTEQFIGFRHGPTKSAADRCKILMEKMKKEILLINTAEISCKEPVELFEYNIGSYDEVWRNADHIDWKGVKIPFFQCENDMVNLQMMKEILKLVQNRKPAFVIAIGSGGIVGAFVSKIVPVLCVGMIPSELIVTGIKYQTLGRKLTADDFSLLKRIGSDAQNVIVGKFGSSLLEQGVKRTRMSAGFPESGFLIALVGARMEVELTDEFWEMAEKLLDGNTFFVILGKYGQDVYDDVLRKHPALSEYIFAVGFTDDVLSYLELCNLYVNPVRRGGGTSCVEAMSKGVPVVTTAYGDVAISAGEAFLTESYETMPQLIEKYKTDKTFYQKQSESARARAEELTNSEDEFVRIVEEFLRRQNLKA